MNWIGPYRRAILSQAPLLKRNGFSLMGEDDNRIQFTDGEVLVKFSVERYEHWLAVYIRHLGEQATNQEYRLDFVMHVVDGDNTQGVVAGTPEEQARLVERDVRYILDNKARLLGPTCTYAKAYSDFCRSLAERTMAQWAAKPGTDA